MTDELMKRRFAELAERSYKNGHFTFTDFLGLAEGAVLNSIKREISYAGITLFGGIDGAERLMARFGNEEELGYGEQFPIVCIKVSPKSYKFSENLTHRDYLGAIMNLGIERDALGDIVIKDAEAYIFVKDTVSEHICDSLTRVRHTEVTARQSDALVEGELYKTETVTVQVSSERLDAVIAKAYHLSRDDAQSLFSRRLVFVSGKECESTSYSPKAGDVISIRGFGRFVYRGFRSSSKKGKLNIDIEKYV